MLKGTILEAASLALNLGFPHELAVGFGATFLNSKPQFLPPYNGVMDRQRVPQKVLGGT